MVTEAEDDRFPFLALLGLVLGAISGVVYPGLLAVPILSWIVPAVIAGVLSISPRTRAMAVGFGAASVGWIAFAMAFGIVPLLAPLLR